jgi:hypothetical protein
MEIGKKTWVFADGDLPAHPEGMGDPKAHEALMVVNNNGMQANLRLTLLFEDKEREGGTCLIGSPKRVSVSEWIYPSGEEIIWFLSGSMPSSWKRCSCCCRFREARRRSNMAYYPVAPYAE